MAGHQPEASLAQVAGTQYIVVVPDFVMVLVATGANECNGQQSALLGVAKRYLEPGIRPAC